MRINTKRLGLLLLLALLVGTTLFIYNHFANSHVVTVNFKNISGLDIYTEKQFSSQDKKTKSISTSGSNVRLKHQVYYFDYRGSGSNYENSYVEIEIGADTKTVEVEAALTAEAEDRLLQKELLGINNAIRGKYPSTINSYTINKGRIYDDVWYGAVLAYNGNDPFIADSLKIILHKESDTWVVATDPPSIFLNAVDFPNIPNDIIERVNSEQVYEIPQKYIDM